MRRMQTSPAAQRGMTTLGLLILLVFLGTFAYAGIRLVPVYLEDLKIAGTFKNVKIRKTGRGYDVSIDYTNKTPFLFNIYFAVDFSHRVSLER